MIIYLIVATLGILAKMYWLEIIPEAVLNLSHYSLIIIVLEMSRRAAGFFYSIVVKRNEVKKKLQWGSK